MTNEMIILWERVRLMEAGLIGSTGRTFTVRDNDGSERVLAEPVEIHTFAHWKNLGYAVKKGEHAVARFAIWKGSEQAVKDDDGDDTGDKKTRMFMKNSCFFSPTQVEPLIDRSEKPRGGSRKSGRGNAHSLPAVAPGVAQTAYGSWLAEA